MTSPTPNPCPPEPPPRCRPPATPTPHPVRPSLSELFIAFATISLSGFGGVLAWSRRMMVEERKWLTAEQFNETYALCAFLPGGNISISRSYFGARFRGPLGQPGRASPA